MCGFGGWEWFDAMRDADFTGAVIIVRALV